MPRRGLWAVLAAATRQLANASPAGNSVYQRMPRRSPTLSVMAGDSMSLTKPQRVRLSGPNRGVRCVNCKQSHQYYRGENSPAPHAANEAELLVAHACGLESASELYYKMPPRATLSARQKTNVQRLVQERVKGVPIAYLVRNRGFWELDLYVDESVLIPRPDSEVLVETSLELLSQMPARATAGDKSCDIGHARTEIKHQAIGKDQVGVNDSSFREPELLRANHGPGDDDGRPSNGAHRVLDLGTGSGCLMLSILHSCPTATGVAVDLSTNALCVAKRNARRNNIDAHRCDWVNLDFGQLATSEEILKLGPFDLIVTNPPYIRGDEMDGLERQVRDHEPTMALTSGPLGLECYEAIAKACQAAGERVLTKDGRVVVEAGFGQASDIATLFQKCGFVLQDVRKDYGGVERCLVFARECV